MKKFLIQYKMPLAGLDAWMQKPEEERKPEETRLMSEWQKWVAANKGNILETFGAGKTKVVDASGVKDFRNEIMIAGIVEGEDREKVAQMFVGHPHLQIPGAWVEITELNPMA
jgi:hypothetical protein